MPHVMYRQLLRAVYEEATRLIEERQVPTELIPPSAALVRSFNQEYATVNTQGVFPRQKANEQLLIRDQFTDQNRFTGLSKCSIKAVGGLYCSLQGQAAINELSHSARANKLIPKSPLNGFPNVDAALGLKCIVRIRLMSAVLAADISAHNPGTAAFLNALGRSPDVRKAMAASARAGQSLAQAINDSEDCSAARGIGLAVARIPWIRALKVTTVRPSARSPEEKGDNIVFFGNDGEQVPGLWIDEAYLFPLRGDPIVCPVEFAPNV